MGKSSGCSTMYGATCFPKNIAEVRGLYTGIFVSIKLPFCSIYIDISDYFSSIDKRRRVETRRAWCQSDVNPYTLRERNIVSLHYLGNA